MLREKQILNFENLLPLGELFFALSKSESTVVLNTDAGENFKIAREKSSIVNPWFSQENISQALEGLAQMMEKSDLKKWLGSYDFTPGKRAKRIGLILAGNIPMVGFHDVFCTAISGHTAVVKLAAQDSLLLPALFKVMYDVTGFEGFQIEWVSGRLPQVDAVIATGSNNTSRYFDYYFGKYPHIIRKNRTSVAIVTGSESDNELKALSDDIFSYFGLGCRNVSKIYFHESFEIDRFFKAIFHYHHIVNHHKYANNYDYYRALWMMNREQLLDNGFLILRPIEVLSSPIATVYYERYSDEQHLRNKLNTLSDEIQCVVSQKDVPFGESQNPHLWDYADGVDTMKFLLEI